jgi:hypothetical protein
MPITVERRNSSHFALMYADHIIGFACRVDGDRWGFFGPDHETRVWKTISFANPKAVAVAVEKRMLNRARLSNAQRPETERRLSPR